MRTTAQKTRIEYGDFQTPFDLADRVCQKLVELGISPDIVVEPTCGVGAFIDAAAKNFPIAQIIGVEINPTYLAVLQERLRFLPDNNRVKIRQGDFFKFDWAELLKESEGTTLILGNFPWVTNSQQGTIGGENLPRKHNFQHHSGWEARTGKSNFDISEWMLIQTAMWLRRRVGYIAMFCKSAVARKFLSHLHSNRINLEHSAIYGIDAKRHFNVSVDACLLVCKFAPEAQNYDYEIFSELDSATSQRVGHRNGLTVRDLDTFEKLNYLHGESDFKWRSGIKHDCSEVMELKSIGDGYLNGLGEQVNIEPAYLYPLLKGSDIANNRLNNASRYVLVTQKYVGEPTHSIKVNAPKTWEYLESHAQYLDNRKSKIYQDNPRFSIFGVGPYTFAPWKIAICGLYKSLNFRLIGEMNGKPAVFDDTVYFVSFDSKEEATRVLNLLISVPVRDFLSALIFWDDKRPIKTSVLNSLNIKHLAAVQQLSLFQA
jgi:hypothetical protein